MAQFVDKRTSECLGFYVYCLIDPIDKCIFYIGKGQNDRIDSHEFETIKKAKNSRINAIEKSGKQTTKIIIAHNLHEDEALRIESILISLLKLKKNYYQSINLLNIQSGYHQSKMVMTLEEINALYAAKSLESVEVKHNILCINVNKTYLKVNQLNADERKKYLYYITRGNWVKLSKSRAEKQELVFSEYNGIVRAIYKPTKWLYDTEDEEFMPFSDVNNPKVCFVGDDVTEQYPEYLYVDLQKKSKTTSRFKYIEKANK